MRKVQELIAKNLTRLRKERGLTQEELAEKSGVSFVTLNRLENCKQFNLNSLALVVKALGIDELELVVMDKPIQPKISAQDALRILADKFDLELRSKKKKE